MGAERHLTVDNAFRRVMPTSSDLKALELQRDELKSQLSQIGEMRPVH